jgi:hypothetical protein
VRDGVGPSRKKALDLLGDLLDAPNQLTGKFRRARGTLASVSINPWRLIPLAIERNATLL